MTRTLALLLFLTACAAPPVPEPAVEPEQKTPGFVCAPHDEITAVLAERWGERLQSVGIIEAGALIEIYASEAGSWTILAVRVDGLACLIAAGQDWMTRTIGKGV